MSDQPSLNRLNGSGASVEGDCCSGDDGDDSGGGEAGTRESSVYVAGLVDGDLCG
eukprot:CAMPEP_0171936348 /NCGR_PEP_ID=MMETSP0993-20121228/33768_1 /TAXON_ID=483369 /ORGANISM="non described non described, Strain CCMP2098" /LENGTH=54 /DNA_ID=CAMNT_0012577507 /DNA_START=44 /DNA_END=205 /DNA_ORIENTATION=-